MTSGTVQTIHHLAAGLTDDEARALEGEVRQFYKRILILQNTTGASYTLAYHAILDADKETHQ